MNIHKIVKGGCFEILLEEDPEYATVGALDYGTPTLGLRMVLR